ncbi:metal ABC transporter solute-binding protein, Zn/Mn family [Falsibacillus pallidus]|uniref:Zinc transport system substrate-binding protein n=1 Tax=Falsibacillus pallidus TaxID=493781 RepID=A0A370GM52_9BACI|nr:zinc ABC transporter substrate-binding protein [Falsibacillus pallidus]RDI44369.1 zinc transport system substrate-binding protein [Falsibacillus pallidus]
MRIIHSLIAVLLVIALAACGNSESDQKSSHNKLNIYTTVYPIEEFTQKIGGKYVSVHTIYPPGSDEHTFEPSQKDMMDLADSDMLFYVGLGLEGFVNKSEQTLKNENVKLIPLGSKIKIDKSAAHSNDDGHQHGDINPHIWLDPVYAKEMAKQIEISLAKEMPSHKDEFQKNYDNLASDLDDLNQKFKEMADSAPQKKFIVSHAAYSYWETRYGLEQISVAGISTSDEPSQKELKNIVDLAKKENINYILFEQNVPSKLTDVVKDEVGAQALTLHNLAVLNQKNIKNHDDYFSLMNHNIETLKTALNSK